MNRRIFVKKASTSLVPLTFFSGSLFTARSPFPAQNGEFEELFSGLKRQMSHGLSETLHLKNVTQYLEPISGVSLQELNDLRSYSFQNRFGHTIKCQINNEGTRSYIINIFHED